MRRIATFLLASTLSLANAGVAQASASKHSAPPKLCAWGPINYASGATCTSRCGEGVCEVQVCMRDGTWLSVGTSRPFSLRPTC
jgi:hypothetical protein